MTGNNTRGKTTPASTGGSFKPHSGIRSRVNLADDPPYNEHAPVDPEHPRWIRCHPRSPWAANTAELGIPQDAFVQPDWIPHLTSTPYGIADGSYRYAAGIDLHTGQDMPLAGAFKLAPATNEQIPAIYRRDNGWYGDRGYVVVLTWPHRFTRYAVQKAIDDARNYTPDQWQAVTGETLTPAQSWLLRDRIEADTSEPNHESRQP